MEMATDSDMRDVLEYLLEKIKEIAPHNKEFRLEFKQQQQPAFAAPPTTKQQQQGCSNDNKRSTVVQLDSLRRQGNRFFKDSNYIAAMNLYSQCIVQSGETIDSLDVLSSNSDEERRQKVAKVQRILFLALSNRAETWLRLKDYSRALWDADRALESEPNHAKCLVRRGKSLDGLQRYEEAVFCFTAALQLFPNDILIKNSLRSSKICHLQSYEGLFDFSNCDDGSALDPCCDFVGPVEIQKLGVDGYGGRGVFLTKSAIAGQLLLVSNALAILGGDPSEKSPLQAIEDYWIARASASLLPTQNDLALHLSFGASRNAELRAKLESLFFDGGGQQADIVPDMELFKPGAKWNSLHPPPPGGGGEGRGFESMVKAHEETVARMRKVVEYNAFTDFDDWGRAYSGIAGREEYLKAGCGGLWLLPSFLNHSCAPNCTKVYIGNAVFVRASRAMDAGEELSLAYCDVSLGVDSRRDRLRKWGFECRCRRCLSETYNNAVALG
ncbi:unnamed protein product [Calypogeia fissa]